EPSRDYVLPLGKGNLVLSADPQKIQKGLSLCVITYGMGVYWAKAASKKFPGQIDVVDLRTLFPLDEDLVFSTVNRHGKCIVLCEESQHNSFAEALAARISKACFQYLDGPVEVMGALNLPAVPLNLHLEKAMLPNAEKLQALMERVLES
ncbi:MAG: tungsten formylmethanofuran dehydrogenase, partial [Bacteroidota bacterium]|nr:tungsten formylmethanofuran dehydrogenase [Bacteroidota bacterium]